jgi:hypothetical protein
MSGSVDAQLARIGGPQVSAEPPLHHAPGALLHPSVMRPPQGSLATHNCDFRSKYREIFAEQRSPPSRPLLLAFFPDRTCAERRLAASLRGPSAASCGGSPSKPSGVHAASKRRIGE